MGRDPFISFNQSIIEKKMRAQLTRVFGLLGSGRLSFTLAIDGTKASQSKKIPQKYKAIIGVSNTNHFNTLDGIYDEELE